MKTRRSAPLGQSIVETVLLLPAILLLLGGGYWFYRNLSLSSSAESASHAQMLRSGRRMPGIEPRLSKTIHPADDVVRIEAHDDPPIAPVPPFRGLAGRTVASVTVSLAGEPVGALLDLPSHAPRREAEGAVDPWGKETRSGSTVRRTVRGIVWTGVLR